MRNGICEKITALAHCFFLVNGLLMIRHVYSRLKKQETHNTLFNSINTAKTIRFLLGALNGLVAIGKCLISEVCGKEHETVGMSFVTGERLKYAWLTGVEVHLIC